METDDEKVDAYLPANLSLTDHVKKHEPAQYGITDYRMNYAIYILSQITEVMAIDKRQYEDQEDDFTRLSSQLLEENVKPYRRYLDYFLNTGIIETDGYYIEKRFDPEGKGKCYGYRFTSYYKYSDLIKVSYSKTFAKKLFKNQKQRINKLYLRYGHLTKHLYPDCCLRIDGERAMQYAQLRRDAQLANPALIEYKKDKRGKLIPKNPHKQYQSIVCNVNKINSGRLQCIVDSRVHRLFSPLTSLKREVRNLIFYERNGQRQYLVTYDIKNCQPYLASILLDVYNVKLIRKISKQCSYKPTECIIEKLCQLYEKEDFGLADFSLYKSLVSNVDGSSMDLYDYMLSKCKEYNIDFKDRDDIKEGMYGVIFGSNEYDSPVKILFASLFPTVNQVFTMIKEKNKEDLPCLLQSMESYFMLINVTKTIAKKYPNAPLYTIHDSITTTEEYGDRVRCIIVKELKRLTGLPPKIKKEHWLPKNVD